MRRTGRGEQVKRRAVGRLTNRPAESQSTACCDGNGILAGADGQHRRGWSAVVVFSEGYADLTPQGQITINAYNAPSAAPKFDVSNTAITLATLETRWQRWAWRSCCLLRRRLCCGSHPAAGSFTCFMLFRKSRWPSPGTRRWRDEQPACRLCRRQRHRCRAAQQTMMYWMIALEPWAWRIRCCCCLCCISRGVSPLRRAVER